MRREWYARGVCRRIPSWSSVRPIVRCTTVQHSYDAAWGVCTKKQGWNKSTFFLVSLGSIIIDVLQLSTIIIMQLSILIMHANSDNCFNLFLFEPTRCTFIYRLWRNWLDRGPSFRFRIRGCYCPSIRKEKPTSNNVSRPIEIKAPGWAYWCVMLY